MIPKIIHYCWFGKKPKPLDVLGYIETWKKFLPDYAIKEWNESNFDICCNRFVYEAYNVKRFAFVSDYCRLQALYTEGGIYLDTDVEVRKSFESFLKYTAFVGYEWKGMFIGTAVLASEKKQKWIKDMLRLYENQPFIYWRGGCLNNEPNTVRLTKLLEKDYGLVRNGEHSVLRDGIAVYPIEYFCAHRQDSMDYCITDETVCIHHFSGSWLTRNSSILRKLVRRVENLLVKIKLIIWDWKILKRVEW